MSTLAHKFSYGYYILTALKKGDSLKTREEDYIAAGTVNWVSQVSFSPEIFSVAVAQKSDLNETIDYSQQFTLHVLTEDHKNYIKTFGEESTIKNGQINGVSFQKINDQAIIEDTAGHLTCKVIKSINLGDHTVYFGEVIHGQVDKDKEGLNTSQHRLEYTQDKAEV